MFKENPVYEAKLERLGRLKLCDPEDLCYMLEYFMRKDAANVPLNTNNRGAVVALLERAADNLAQAGLDYYVSLK